MTVEQIEREAFTLNSMERGALAAKLVASLDEQSPKGLQKEPESIKDKQGQHFLPPIQSDLEKGRN